MPSRILALPFVIAALVFLYLTWEVDESYSVYIIPCALVLAIIYVFNPQINWWWYKRRPPKLDPPIRMLLEKQHAFYRQLPPAEQERFRQRVALYMIAHEYMPQAMESVPDDVKAVVAINAVYLSFGQEDFIMEPFERIVIYPKPFPSPQFPEKFHASELYEEDGVLLFAAEQLMRSFLQPGQYYNTGLHEFAKVFLHLHPDAGWPEPGENTWEMLEEISRFSREAIVQWINLPEAAVPARAVMISHFFVFPERFQQILPGAFAQLKGIFEVDPVGEGG